MFIEHLVYSRPGAAQCLLYTSKIGSVIIFPILQV
jgi:hypothetical protein